MNTRRKKILSRILKDYEKNRPKDFLTLKYGRPKDYDFSKSRNLDKIAPLLKVLRRSQARSRNSDGLTPKARKVLCEVIDLMDNPCVYLDMFCVAIPKENAKEYIMKHPQTMGEIEEANKQFLNKSQK